VVRKRIIYTLKVLIQHIFQLECCDDNELARHGLLRSNCK